ncbi:MAG: DNA repair protein RecO [Flavobacteriales bacterium]|nr:DNA repair protein RecO [Flavobacteriales bacterium]|tara:strand:+ start:436 stop:1152 length:717 start_codon:yes stop_codon:yes gene_type:complete
MLTNSEAIILGYINYSETSVILKTYTRGFGFKSFIIRGIRTKKKKKITLGQLQPLNILDIEFNNKNSELSYLKTIRIIEPYNSINDDIIKINICLFLAEFLSKILKIDLKNEPLFEFIKQSLLWFDNSSKSSNFHLLFILKLSDYLGIMPKHSSEESLYFDIENGIFTNTPMSNNYIKDRVVKDLKDILGIKFDYNNEILNNINQRKDMLNFLISYYEYHVPGFKRPKSVDILNEVFS